MQPASSKSAYTPYEVAIVIMPESPRPSCHFFVCAQRWTMKTVKGGGWSAWMRWPPWRNSSQTWRSSKFPLVSGKNEWRTLRNVVSCFIIPRFCTVRLLLASGFNCCRLRLESYCICCTGLIWTHDLLLFFRVYRLYKERLSQVDVKLQEVMAGCAQEYLEPLANLQENMQIRTKVAGTTLLTCTVALRSGAGNSFFQGPRQEIWNGCWGPDQHGNGIWVEYQVIVFQVRK